MQLTTRAIGNMCNWQHVYPETRASGNTCKWLRDSLDLVIRAGRTNWTDQLDGPAGRTSWTYQLDRKAGRTSWTDQLDGSAGRISWTDQFSLLEALASLHIRRLTFQFVHCRSFRVRGRPCLSLPMVFFIGLGLCPGKAYH